MSSVVVDGEEGDTILQSFKTSDKETVEQTGMPSL